MKAYNKVTLSGRLHSFKLDLMETKNGQAIGGTITVEVNKDGNTVEARVFASPKWSSGKVNRTYDVLEEIMSGEWISIADTHDDPTVQPSWITVDGSIDVSYFVGKEGAKSADDVRRGQKIRGVFVQKNSTKEYKNYWTVDMLATKVVDVEADPEKGRPAQVLLQGYGVDSYHKRLFGLSFTAINNPAAMNYVRSLDGQMSLDQPLYTKVSGEIITLKNIKVVEAAFGNDEKTEYDNSYWAINMIPRIPYTFGEDITAEEYTDFKAELEDHIQEVYKDWTENGNDENGDNLVF